MEGMFSSKIAQLIEIFSAQMMLFDAFCADYLWVFCGNLVKMVGGVGSNSNPPQFLHLLEAFQCGLDIRHGIVGILKFATE